MKNQYYHFNDEQKEIVFSRYDMPTPWMNYLTNGEMFTMISQAGGNLSWYKSPQIWRIGRYNFYNLPTDECGMTIYIKDKKTGEVWNPTYMPCRTKLDFWESAHGLGYTRFKAEKDGVKVELKCFIGKENILVYAMDIESKDDREIDVFACQEMAMMEYLKEVQWQCYCKQSQNILYDKESDALVYEYFTDMQARPEETPFVFFCSDRKLASYDGDRNKFLGAYRSLREPISLERGCCGNSELRGGEGMFAGQISLSLKGGETQSAAFYLGTFEQNENVEQATAKIREGNYAKKAFEYVKEYWSKRLSTFQVETPDPSCQRMANVWNPLQAYVNFLVCREISYYATGTVRGIGMRDCAQDILANIAYDLQASKEKLKLLFTQQYQSGKTNHYFYPVEKREPVISDRSDNHMWLVFTTYKILCEEGKLDFLQEVVPYYDGGEGTILEHIEKSVNYCSGHIGKDGLPLMLGSDWNDMLTSICKKGKGESVFVAQMLVIACKMLAEIYERLGKDGSRYATIAKTQEKVINEFAWNEDRYIRAVSDEGLHIGNRNERCGALWLNSQSWAVISGVADKEKGNKAFDTVMNTLDCGYGLLKLYPPLERNYPSKENELTFAQPGVGENGGVFSHANTWAIIALCMLGRNQEAYKIYKELIPDSVTTKFGVERYCSEPYIYSSNIRGPRTTDAGKAGVSWLTGTAAWMQIALSEYIYGVQPTLNGLVISPCIPDEWEKVSAQRVFRGTTYRIQIDNTAKCGNHVKQIFVNGKKVEGNLVFSQEKNVDVLVVMGKE